MKGGKQLSVWSHVQVVPGWGVVTDNYWVLASVEGVRIVVSSRAAPSLSMPQGLCRGKLTKLFASGKHPCEMASDNPEKID